MPSSVELREQRAALWAQANEIVNTASAEQRDLTGEENEKVDRIFADVDKLKSEIDTLEKREKVASLGAELSVSQGRKTAPAQTRGGFTPTEQDVNEAWRTWALAGSTEARCDAESAYKAAQCGINVASKTLNLRALSKGTTAAPVPTHFSAEYTKALKYYFPVGEHFRQLVTADGNDLKWTIVSDTSNAAAIVSEEGTIGTSTDNSFSTVTIKSWLYHSPIVKVSLQLLRDSYVPIPQLLADLFADRFGRAYDTAAMTGGAGSAGPQGLDNAAAVGVNLATGNAFTHAKLIDLISSVDRAYRSRPGTAFITHDTTLAAIRKLVDGQSRPLWEPSLQLGVPDRLYGYPVYVSNAIAEYAGSEGDNKPLVYFGDLSQYLWRTVAGESVMGRLDELFAGTGQCGFYLHQAVDGRYIGPSGAIKSLNSFDAP